MVDSEDRHWTEKASQSVPFMIKWRCCPELVQFHGLISVEVLLDTPPESPKNCPEAKGGSVRVQISPSRPVSVYMVSRGSVQVEIIAVQSSRPLGFGQVLSDQPAASRLEHSGAKSAHARHVFGWTSVSSPSYSAGSRKPLIRWIGMTQIDESVVEGSGTLEFLTLYPKPGLGTGLGLVVDSERIVPSPSHSASGPWCWVGRGVTEVVSEHGFVHASGTYYLIGCWLALLGGLISIAIRLLLVFVGEGSLRPNPNPKRKITDSENWAVVWTGQMGGNKTSLGKDFISSWEDEDRGSGWSNQEQLWTR
uniref:Uncharacterized protein n=1 Tax=Brassica oleracea var. oleracea TaxID=109376 RepID=A0A0D2ZRN7_BRAOL